MALTLTDILDDTTYALTKRASPRFIAPMLAKLTEGCITGPDWLFERKFDGERAVVVVRDARARLYSRNEKNISGTYPELIGALQDAFSTDCVIDGEVVAFEGRTTSFARLQNRMQLRSPAPADIRKTAVYFYAFDCMQATGRDLTAVPLRERKQVLRAIGSFSNKVRFATHRAEKGEQYHSEACARGWEGVIAKRAESTYKQTRSSDWQKCKCVNEDEFVIGGYTDPKGSRSRFGALLIGFYDRTKKFRYAGKIGTGFSDAELERLHERMQPLETDRSPFADSVRASSAHFIEPKLVAQVGYTEWTGDKKLRHPRYLGLRRDKDAKDVTY